MSLQHRLGGVRSKVEVTVDFCAGIRKEGDERRGEGRREERRREERGGEERVEGLRKHTHSTHTHTHTHTHSTHTHKLHTHTFTRREGGAPWGREVRHSDSFLGS